MSATRFSAPSTSKTPSERIELGSEGRDALPQGFRFHARVLAHPTYDDENEGGPLTASVRATVLLGVVATLGCSEPRPPAHMADPRATASAGAGGATASPAGGASSARLAFTTRGFAGPESVLYDEVRDRYLVSNLNGALPGFVSIVDPDGRVITPRAIEGDRGGVTLRDPHGMGILDGLLFVADVVSVRLFYVADGTPAGEIEI